LDECRRALKLEAFLFIPVMLTLQATGLVLAAYYHQHPGPRGLVIASIFAAAMSTVSGGIKSLTTATLMDFYKRRFRPAETGAHYAGGRQEDIYRITNDASAVDTHLPSSSRDSPIRCGWRTPAEPRTTAIHMSACSCPKAS
jgi:hypothetical protein